MTARQNRRAFRRAHRLALALGLALGCGSGPDVHLGNATSAKTGTGGSGGAAGPDADSCGATPCANHTGTRAFVDASASDAPASFDGATEAPAGTSPAREPGLIYPSDETMFPIDLAGVRFEWSAANNGAFELEFSGPKTRVLVYTHDTSYVPDGEAWDWIAVSNRGGGVTLTVHGLDPAAPAQAYRSQPITLYFSPSPAQGAIYYWAPTGQGVMRARLSDPSAVKVYTDPAGPDKDKCAGCHAVSRDGKHLAAAVGPELRVVALPSLEQELPLEGGGGAGPADPMMMMPDKPPPMMMMPVWWTTFSPDGRLLLTAGGGKLTLYDAKTGAVLVSPANMPIPDGSVATHPDWSPLGDQVAFTLASKGGERNVEGGSIARMTFQGESFGAPEVLVPSAGGDDNNYFPVFSPDARFLAFVNTSGKSQDSPGATLRLLELATSKSIALTRLNERVNDQDGVTGVGNAMPTWAPATSAGLFWLSFSSLRPYASLRPLDNKADQIWVAAIDPCREDPSFAAFWAPFQDMAQGNHRPFWARAEGDTCEAAELCADGIDNDCDGVTDEPDCVPRPDAAGTCSGP
jgi:hypothetical protein